MGVPPNHPLKFKRIFPHKPFIVGYPHFRKHPHDDDDDDDDDEIIHLPIFCLILDRLRSIPWHRAHGAGGRDIPILGPGKFTSLNVGCVVFFLFY